VITKKSKYAYKAMLILVDEYGRGPILISTISEKANIPKKFLEVILLELRHAGYVDSKKGKGGGYFLKIPPSQISLAKVFRTIEGPIAPLGCVSLNFYQKCEDCESEINCRFRKLMEKIRDANLSILENSSFSDLAKINEID
jgi:Rrf2 family protein